MESYNKENEDYGGLDPAKIYSTEVLNDIQGALLDRDANYKNESLYEDAEVNIYLEPDELNEEDKQKLVVENCSVDGCKNKADFAVFLFDKYQENNNEIFCEQDFTCPYLCNEHQQQNEQSAMGNRRARGNTSYLFTNKHGAQGYTKYCRITKKYNLKTISEISIIDYIGIQFEVDSFTNLISNNELDLPVTIGLYGSWGSGKTFFINSLIKSLKQKSKNKYIFINFDAWNYYDTNITINLVYYILNAINQDLSKSDCSFLKELKHYKKIRRNELENKKNNLDSKIEELEEQKEHTRAEKVSDLLNAIPDNKYIDKIDESRTNLQELSKQIRNVPIIFNSIKKNKVLIISFIFCVFLAVILWLYEHSTSSVITLFAPFIINIREFFKLYNIKKIYTDTASKILEIDKNQKSFDSELEKLKTARSKLSKEEQNINEEMLNIDFIKDYISKQLSSNHYINNMGFISTVKEDMDNIKNIIKTLNTEGEEKKIVLVIDDLDRCPGDKILEVLQAIQLLLTTDIFIIIIAVEPKWIYNSVIENYSFNRETKKFNSNMFAISYLEKIIHIPFWLENLNYNKSVKYINGLLNELNRYDNAEKDKKSISSIYINSNSKNTIDNTIENISLDNQDLNIISNLAFVFSGTNPRKVKRFFNSLLLVKYVYYSKITLYNRLIFVISTLIFKSSIFCKLYKSMIANSTNDDNLAVDIMESNFKNESFEKHEIICIKDAIEYLKKYALQTTMKEFSELIYIASRYTYYYDEIFGDN